MPATIQYGNLAEWVAAGVTFLFFGATWMTISRDHKEKRQQRDEARQDQAQLVSVRVSYTRSSRPSDGQPITAIGITVVNNARRQIDHLQLSVWDGKGQPIGDNPVFIGSIAAGCESFFSVPWTNDAFDPSGRFAGTTELSFTDTAGTAWTRNRDGILASVPAPRRHWWNRGKATPRPTDSSLVPAASEAASSREMEG
jgi:hypothetical protein